MTVNSERDRLAEDILYLEYLIEVEKSDIKQRLNQRLALDDSDGERIDVICDEISSSLAQLCARVAVLEKVLVNRAREALPESSGSVRLSSVEGPLKAEVSVSTKEIIERNPLIRVKYSVTGQIYLRMMPDSKIEIDLAVDRSEKKTLAVNLYEEIDHAFLNKVKILVDGEHTKHKIAHVGESDRLICHLPVIPGRSTTQVAIITPAVSSGSCCLSDIHCVPRQSLSRIVKRLLT
jgi:hypothetical protein